MKIRFAHSFRLLAALFTIAAGNVFSQNSSGETFPVPLTDPSRPATVKVYLVSGSITVKGYNGKDVVVQAKRRDESSRSSSRADKQSGLRLIPNSNTGLSIEEDDNFVAIGAGGGYRTVDVSVQVPFNTSLKLHTVNDGDIEVEQVNGELEIDNTNGAVTMNHISGSAVAHALNGAVRVTFDKVTEGKTMSFSSLNGDIDVTFPSSLRADLQMKSEQGEIYTDFDMKMTNKPTTLEENSRGKKGKYVVKLDKGMSGTVNGGGPEIKFKNFNGNIYIRKGK